MPSYPAFQIKGSALCVGFIQLSPISAQSHLRNWDDPSAVCETSLYMGPSVPRGPGHWSLGLGSYICSSWICIDVFPCNSFRPLLRWARGTAGLTECPLPGILWCVKLWSRRGCAEMEHPTVRQSWMEQGCTSQGIQLGANPLSVLSVLCHKPSLAWCSHHSVCPFKHSVHRVSCSGTQAV